MKSKVKDKEIIIFIAKTCTGKSLLVNLLKYK